jgi:hypothetical protein
MATGRGLAMSKSKVCDDFGEQYQALLKLFESLSCLHDRTIQLFKGHMCKSCNTLFPTEDVLSARVATDKGVQSSRVRQLLYVEVLGYWIVQLLLTSISHP